ncbi:MAG: N-6 DNA methylase [Candidatus Paceibacterota bacterium]
MQNNKSIQNWILERYNTLLATLKKEDFSFDDASNILKKKHEDSKAQVRNILSDLTEAEMIESRENPKDKRKRIYNLVPIAPEGKDQELSRQELNSLVDRAADIIRTRVDYTFILLLLFYKRISDKWMYDYKKSIEKFKKEGFTEEEAKKEAKEPEYHDLDFPKKYLWQELRKDPLSLSQNFSEAMKEIGDRNENLKNIFSQFDFIQFAEHKENSEILQQLFELLSSYSLEKASPDVLGDAYERILKKFAPEKAKEGEVYTPRQVVELMIRVLGPEAGDSVYDPALGSGIMLIKAHNYVIEKEGKKKADTLFLYGQEHSQKILGLAHMNLIIHNIKQGFLEHGDTLLRPKFKDKGSFKRFDKGAYNPPWNQKAYGEEELKKAEYSSERFQFGYTTKQSADWAWVQHMNASIKDSGKFTVVLDTGAVSRGSGSKSNREKVIRQKFVENDLIEAVILLPDNLFYNTSAPGIVMVVNKNKPKERKGKILLINATNEFEKGKPKNFLTEENIKKISETYQSFKEIDEFSVIVEKKEVEEADCNLSPSRFVFAINKEDHRSIKEIWKDIEKLEKEEKENDKKVGKIIGKLS